MSNNDSVHKTVKYRFLTAILKGELGTIDSQGVIITTRQFKYFFNDLNRLYATSFLPAATIEAGRSCMSHTKYVIRLNRGVYRLHEDAIKAHAKLLQGEGVPFIESILHNQVNEVVA